MFNRSRPRSSGRSPRGSLPGRIRTPLVAVALLASGCSSNDVGAVVVDLDGKVNDYAASAGLEGALITLYTYGGSYLGETVTDGEGLWSATLAVPWDPIEGVQVHAFVEADGYVNTDLYEQFYVRDPEASSLILQPAHRITTAKAFVSSVNMVPNSGRPGTFSGRIFDAESKNQETGLGGLSLLVREGVNPPEDAPIIASTVTRGSGPEPTEDSGSFVFEAFPPGTYTVFVDGAEDYLDFYYSVAVVGGEILEEVNGGTTAPIEEDQARMVLTWGDSPENLDFHLTGTVDQGAATAFLDEDRWHVWPEQTAYPVDAGPDSALAFQDVADDDGFGPETVTVRDFGRGTYRLSVHDWTNQGAAETLELSLSGARVGLWIDGDYQSYDVPQGEFGTSWTVLEIDGQSRHFFPVNNFDAVADPSNGDLF